MGNHNSFILRKNQIFKGLCVMIWKTLKDPLEVYQENLRKIKPLAGWLKQQTLTTSPEAATEARGKLIALEVHIRSKISSHPNTKQWAGRLHPQR